MFMECVNQLQRGIVTSKSIFNKKPRFVAVRYGNVLESRGSIIPLFRHQAINSKAFTITHPAMTRFIMTLDESIELIVKATLNAKSGQTWIPFLPSMKVLDLAKMFSQKYNKPIKNIGIRPGEKIDESLISEPESLRVLQRGKYYIMENSLVTELKNAKLFSYSSKNEVLSFSQLHNLLMKKKDFRLEPKRTSWIKDRPL